MDFIFNRLTNLSRNCRTIFEFKYALQIQFRMPSRQIPFDMVVARCLNNGIGLNNTIPWKLSKDLKMFKKITTSGNQKNAIIMGRKTYESIGSKPLPNRVNIVLSKNSKIEETQNIKQAGSLQQALDLAKFINQKSKVYVIGGAKIYEQGMADCRFIYETLINEKIQCDTFLAEHGYPCKFISKTQSQKQLIYDHRIYLNSHKYPNHETQNAFGVPQHEQYQYLRMIRNIIDNGEEKIDRTKTGTKSIFGGMMRYDLRESFPLLTHKKVFWRGVAQQLLWFVKGSTDARELQNKKIHIWDGNSSKQYLNSIGIDRQAGDLGPVYGFQWRHWNAPYTDRNQSYQGKGIDQLAQIINQIKTNPTSRRLIMSAWNPSQMKEMALPPCHLLSQFYVTNDNKLSCILYQRSCDMGLGVPFNIASYSLLTCLIAQVTGLGRGQFIHMMADMHVYKDHIESLKGIENLEPYAFPQLYINPEVKNIDGFEFKDFQIKGYRSYKKIPMKMSV